MARQEGFRCLVKTQTLTCSRCTKSQSIRNFVKGSLTFKTCQSCRCKGAQSKRKRKRNPDCCQSCRSLKKRCDRSGNTMCSRCVKFDLTCVAPSQAQDDRLEACGRCQKAKRQCLRTNNDTECCRCARIGFKCVTEMAECSLGKRKGCPPACIGCGCLLLSEWGLLACPICRELCEDYDVPEFAWLRRCSEV